MQPGHPNVYVASSTGVDALVQSVPLVLDTGVTLSLGAPTGSMFDSMLAAHIALGYGAALDVNGAATWSGDQIFMALDSTVVVGPNGVFDAEGGEVYDQDDATNSFIVQGELLKKGGGFTGSSNSTTAAP